MTIPYPTISPLASPSRNGFAPSSLGVLSFFSFSFSSLPYFSYRPPTPIFFLFFFLSSGSLSSSFLLPLLPSPLLLFHHSFLSQFFFCSYSKKLKTNITKVKDSYLLFLFFFLFFFLLIFVNTHTLGPV